MNEFDPEKSYKFTRGIHKGKTLEWVKENDRYYFCWILKNGFKQCGEGFLEEINGEEDA